jgi:phage terminase Nu1 subunit (DNA packaging protein)
MSKIKKIQLAELLQVSRAAITKAVGSGLLVSEDGLIDLENPVNKYYIASRGIILSGNEVENMPKKEKTSEKQNIKSEKADFTSEQVAEFVARKKKADAEHAELKNQKMRGELLDAELVNDMLFLFLDKVANNLQRNASAFLSDVANRIITEGALTSSVRNQWMNLVLEQLDIAKKEIIKRIDQLKEKQNS